jgi:hypothetical protein
LGGEQDEAAPSIQRIHEAPEVVSLEGKELFLDTYLWRNFMPSTNPSTGLQAIFFVIVQDSTAFPEGVEADSVFVVHGDSLWTTMTDTVASDHPDSKSYNLVRRVEGGPPFEPEVHVDVAIRLTTASGETHLLKAEDQFIVRAE